MIIRIECTIPARYFREVSNVAIHIRQPPAITERPITDRSYRVGDDDAGQTCAPKERTATDNSYRVGNIDAGQICAVSKRPETDISYRVGNDDAGQTFAVLERCASNTFSSIS